MKQLMIDYWLADKLICYWLIGWLVIDARIGAQVEISRTSNERLKLPPVVTYVTRYVTYVTRLPIPSSPSGTSLSFLNQSSTATDRRPSSVVKSSAWAPSPHIAHRTTEEPASTIEPTAEVILNTPFTRWSWLDELARLVNTYNCSMFAWRLLCSMSAGGLLDRVNGVLAFLSELAVFFSNVNIISLQILFFQIRYVF